MKRLKILVTGGAGFIGSALCRHIIQRTDYSLICVDKLTYAGNLLSLKPIQDSERLTFIKEDICNLPAITEIFKEYRPDGIMHLAAESHVDRSIDSPDSFIQTNIFGTYNLLEASLKYCKEYGVFESFRFHHISTDEVFGSLGVDGKFKETTAYDPSSPYSASKASADHLVRAWGRTYKLPILITNCSNNYGPYHFPEKLIPLIISNAKSGLPISVYGDGMQIRDWLYVEDHVSALLKVFEIGKIGETYNIGGNSERTNLEVVREICNLLDKMLTDSFHYPHSKLITFVTDRPGHDRRYAIDSSKIQKELGWTPKESFETGIEKTVKWFLENQEWIESTKQRYTGDRLGVRK